MRNYSSVNNRDKTKNGRITFLWLAIFLFGLTIISRLAYLQLIKGDYYSNQAANQQQRQQKLWPERGEIFLKVKSGLGEEITYPLASNRNLFFVHADPFMLDDYASTTKALLKIIGLEYSEGKTRADYDDFQYNQLIEQQEKTMAEKIAAAKMRGSHYLELRKKLTDEQAQAIEALKIEGLGLKSEDYRYYPASEANGQLLGYVGGQEDQRRGYYGLEGYWNKELSGTAGEMKFERDAAGRIIALGDLQKVSQEDGSSLVLTIDQTIQRYVCSKIEEAVKKHGATGGSVIVQNPKTGAIIAMCNYPDYNPGEFSKQKDLKIFNNPAIFFEYEPGSVIKAMSMAAAVNEGKVNAQTTYNDTGEERYGKFTIRNSDLKGHGIQTMTQVLEKSLNTGAIFAMRQIGAEKFSAYIKNFGFGAITGIELNTEIPGNISSLDKKGEIYAATASYGQGISVTPIQLVNAYSVLANGGVLMKPYLVQEMIKPSGDKIFYNPKEMRQVINTKTASEITAMLVSVVVNGHGKRAGVPGYLVAGKTGTAQIPSQNGGYEANAHIGNFVGYAPADNPKFTMLVKIDRPADVEFAESSAAPVFGDIAKFILEYYQIEPSQKNLAGN